MSACSRRCRRTALAVLAAMLAGFSAPMLSPAAGQGPAYLVADINPFPDPEAGSEPRAFTVAGDAIFFLAKDTPLGGGELWVSDGTPSGTRRLHTFDSLSAAGLVAIDDSLYLSGVDARDHRGLWRVGPDLAPPEVLHARIARWIGPGLGGMLFATATALWRSPGPVGVEEAVFEELAGCLVPPGDIGGAIVFGARNGLWRSDGTAEGLVPLPGPEPADCGDRPESATMNGVYYFLGYEEETGVELWRSDGTAAGTRLVADIRPGPEGAFVLPPDGDTHLAALTVAGDVLYFVADDGVSGLELWRSDGTAAGTRLVRDIVPGADGLYRFEDGNRVFPSGIEIRARGAEIVFSAPDADFSRRQLWTSDGTAEGTVPVANDVAAFAVAGERVYFARDAGDGSAATGLWLLDLASGDETFVGPGGAVGEIAAVGEAAIAAASDGVLGVEPWWSDGTVEGAVLLADIVARQQGSHPAGLVDVNGVLVFHADDGVNGTELWRSDGTREGTALVRDIHPGPGSSLPPARSLGPQVDDQLVAAGRLYFTADDGVHGRELWRSDGTLEGTAMVADLAPGASSADPRPLAALGDRLFFFTDRGGDRDLWTTDGTEAGTAFVFRFRSPAGAALAARPGVVALDGMILFEADDGIHGAELWRSDGTTLGTALVADLRAGAESGLLGARMVVLGGAALIADSRDARGLWRSDGTEAGTFLLGGAFPSGPLAFGERVYFNAVQARRSLWQTDGTAAATRPRFESAQDLVAIGPALFGTGFSDGQMRLWRLEQGDILVADAEGGATLTGLAAAAGRPVLARFGLPEVAEIWTSDGTADGTRRVQSLAGLDLEPAFTAAGGRAFFRADDGRGTELWALAVEELDEVCTDDCPRPPTPTPTPQPEVCEQECVQIEVGSASGRAGETVEIDVTLRARGYDVFGAQNDLVLGPEIAVESAGGVPDCSVNPAIDRNATLFSFLVVPCGAEETCQAVRTILLPIVFGRAVADGAVLYTCRVRIAADAPPGRYPVLADGVSAVATGASDTVEATGRGGTVTVVGSGGGCALAAASPPAWPALALLAPPVAMASRRLRRRRRSQQVNS